MSTIKYNRAKAASKIGQNHASFDAMWDLIPDDTCRNLSGAQLGQLVDAFWKCAGDSKALAEREAIQNGFVWDARQNRSRDIAA